MGSTGWFTLPGDWDAKPGTGVSFPICLDCASCLLVNCQCLLTSEPAEVPDQQETGQEQRADRHMISAHPPTEPQEGGARSGVGSSP
jgi:hypothetical protein